MAEIFKTISINKDNLEAHLYIEQEITNRQNGNMTFTIRVNKSNIVDCNVREYVPVQQKYGSRADLRIEQVIVQEFIITPDNSQRSACDTLWPDNF